MQQRMSKRDFFIHFDYIFFLLLFFTIFMNSLQKNLGRDDHQK